MKFGLRFSFNAELELLLQKTAEKLKIKKPALVVFESNLKSAFVVSGFKKTIFLSTALIDSLSSEELSIVLEHELSHLKSGFFNLKRFFYSIKNALFGFIPIPFNLRELDVIEELKLNKTLSQSKELKLNKIREKL